MGDKRFPSETQPKLMVRLPADLKDWLQGQADRNGSSQNSEVVRAIQERRARCDQQSA